jgi:hypothetical protein
MYHFSINEVGLDNHLTPVLNAVAFIDFAA